MHHGTINKTDKASKYIEIDNAKMHYLEMGTGRPILFLHSIPMSSAIWRKMLPHLATMGRCIAPDLIGFGQSDKPANLNYSVFDHIHFIDKFIEKLGLTRIVIIMHGFGSVIGFHYAMHHENNCSGLAFYESFVRPLTPDDISLPYKEHLLSLEHESAAQSKLNPKHFIEHLLTQLSLGNLSEKDKEPYLHAFKQAKSLEPILEYLRELPTGDGNNQIDHVIGKYFKQLAQSKIPKLMLYSVPGFITSIATVMWAKEHINKLEVMELGEELHLGNLTYGERMSEMISIWLQAIEQGGG